MPKSLLDPEKYEEDLVEAFQQLTNEVAELKRFAGVLHGGMERGMVAGDYTQHRIQAWFRFVFWVMVYLIAATWLFVAIPAWWVIVAAIVVLMALAPVLAARIPQNWDNLNEEQKENIIKVRRAHPF